MIGNRESFARLKSDLYRDNYHKILNILILESIIILLLMIAIVYFVFFQPLPKYYATTSEGKVIPMAAARQ